MNEKEWDKCEDIRKMLDFVKGDRKKRLFACACVRQNWHLLKDIRSKQAVIVSEKYADGLVKKQKLTAAYADSWNASCESACSLAWDATWCISYDSNWAANVVIKNNNITSIPLLKDIFDPFRKFKKPLCNKYTKKFVETIYQNPNEKGELLDLYVLADMLIDQNVDQVNHLRSGTHVRGCQVIDLILEKQ